VADAPPDLVATFECRCRAIEALAALDGPALSSVWRLGYEPLIEDLVVGMREVHALTSYAATLAGVEPKVLPRPGDGQRPREKGADA
jgi:hypothetical protein